MKTDNTEQGTE